jgi:DNA-binding NtrC family response regulator
VARRDAFSVFISREALARLAEHDWPGNHRELKLLAANALVFCLTRHLDVAPRATDGARAPAVLDVPDPLVTRLLGAVASKPAKPVVKGRAGARRIEIEVQPEASFARVSADVERQYLRALFEACGGDLARMAQELLGPRGNARQVHLRLNQLGLRLRDMRKTA